MLPPEEGVALEVIIVIEAHEGIFLLGAEHFEDGFVDDVDARMVHVGLVGVLDEEHVADEPHQSVANPETVLVATLGKGLSNLALGGKLILEIVEVIGLADKVMFARARDGRKGRNTQSH